MRQDNLCAAHPNGLGLKYENVLTLLFDDQFYNFKMFHLMASNVSYLYHSYHLYQEFFIFHLNEAR